MEQDAGEEQHGPYARVCQHAGNAMGGPSIALGFVRLCVRLLMVVACANVDTPRAVHDG